MKVLSLVSVLFLVGVNSQNCILTPPQVNGQSPVSAASLMTPWVISPNPAFAGMNTCSQLILGTAVFVEATIIDQVTGVLNVYHPLIVDSVVVGAAGSAAVAPTPVTLSANAVVGLWFGSNGMSLTLGGNQAILNLGGCINGASTTAPFGGSSGPGTSIFGQFAYCNALAFFNAAQNLISSGVLTIPKIGTTVLGVPCPTTRSFAVVDQDQSDNVVTTYLITSPVITNGVTTTQAMVAQNTATNRNNLGVLAIVGNGSDNRLLDVFINKAVGCADFTAPDLTDFTTINNNGVVTNTYVMSPSLALNELSAAQASNAIVASGHAMVVSPGNVPLNFGKMVAYRNGVNQGPGQGAIPGVTYALTQLPTGDTAAYCQNMAAIMPPWVALHYQLLAPLTAPDPAVGNNLVNFLAGRFVASWTALNCQQLTGLACPVTVTTDANQVAIGNNILTAFGQNSFVTLNQPFTVGNTIIVVVVILVVGVLVNFIAVFGIQKGWFPHCGASKSASSSAKSPVAKTYEAVPVGKKSPPNTGWQRV